MVSPGGAGVPTVSQSREAVNKGESKMSETQKEIIYFRESWIGSVISDCVTFAIPAILAWANYAFLGNAWLFQLTIVIIFFILTASKGSKKAKIFHSKKELLEYLNEEK